ncbi:hypothetical protein GCM10022420_048790 [Streptomyces iranensis]|uniref:Uncharacterized protein n=1 Tax=Streptomyces iranensis TaxID=576784 RepID=A0A060ZQH9_9ACTN|nr:predicted protein [Streptomyces iranensis]
MFAGAAADDEDLHGRHPIAWGDGRCAAGAAARFGREPRASPCAVSGATLLGEEWAVLYPMGQPLRAEIR